MEKERNTPAIEHQKQHGYSRRRSVRFECMNLSHIQRLARLLDNSDIREIEIRRAEEGLHLSLRKFQAPGQLKPGRENQSAQRSDPVAPIEAAGAAPEASDCHCLQAHVVGTFHPWLKPGGKVLVAPGDLVRAGQVIGTIEALSLFNELEAPVAGRVREICAHDNQPVEYGQTLLTIDSSAGETL